MKPHPALAVVLWMVVAFATRDVYFLENGKLMQSCSYVSTCDTWYERMFRTRPAQIVVSEYGRFKDGVRVTSESDGSPDGIDVYVLVMGADDLRKVNLGIEASNKICDSKAAKAGHCSSETDEQKSLRKHLSAIIEANDFSFPIQSVIHNTASKDPFLYRVPNSGMYCTVLHSGDIPAEGTLAMSVHWAQSYGELPLEEFEGLYLAFCIMCAFALNGVLYLYTLHREHPLGKTMLGTLRGMQLAPICFPFQLLILTAGIVIVEFSTILVLLYSNSTVHNLFLSWMCGTFQVVSSTMLTVWVLYSAILFSAGVGFLPSPKSDYKRLFAKYSACALLLAILLHDLLSQSVFSLVHENAHDAFSFMIRIQFLGTILLCLGWAAHTYRAIEDKPSRDIYFQTAAVVGAVFSCDMILGLVSGESEAAFVSAINRFAGLLALALIWRHQPLSTGAPGALVA